MCKASGLVNANVELVEYFIAKITWDGEDHQTKGKESVIIQLFFFTK